MVSPSNTENVAQHAMSYPCLLLGSTVTELLRAVQKIAKEIADDEIAHVELLRAALGDAAVPCPLIDIGPAFAAAANAATGAMLDPAFDPYGNDVLFLHGAFIFEDVGVTAYGGAVEPLSTLIDGGMCLHPDGVDS